MSPEIRPKSFGTFEKRAPDPSMMLTTEAELLQYRSKFSYHCSVARDQEKPSLSLDFLAILSGLLIVLSETIFIIYSYPS